ncbi:hypothetical protein [Natronosalvus vescus]|uniref:hypothetical protein n=1 Tax=Natronosalvus vescus TaxID=2953881 RepID=UPI0020912360|nr:hypothetical protein [Natronosalvus vescus]
MGLLEHSLLHRSFSGEPAAWIPKNLVKEMFTYYLFFGGIMPSFTSRRAFLSTALIGTLAGCAEYFGDEEEGTTANTNTDMAAETDVSQPQTLTDEARKHTISVDTEPFEDTGIGFELPASHVRKYSYESIEVRIEPDSPLLGLLESETEYVIEALILDYSTGEEVGHGESEKFVPSELNEPTHVAVETVFYVPIPENVVTYYLVYREASHPPTVGRFLGEPLMATNPFRVTEEGIEQATPEHERESKTIDYRDLSTQEYHPPTGTYSRINVEGGYLVYFSPETPSWAPKIQSEMPFYIPKMTYDKWKNQDRPRVPESAAERTRYITESFEIGMGNHIANIINNSGFQQGVRSPEELLEYISTFVQSLPYALDSISTGYADYSRYASETLVDAQGDCVDTSILLAVAILGGPLMADVGLFSYDSDATGADAGHIAVAVNPENFSLDGPTFNTGSGRYHYIEPTAFWRPGEVPSQLRFDQGAFHEIQEPEGGF